MARMEQKYPEHEAEILASCLRVLRRLGIDAQWTENATSAGHRIDGSMQLSWQGGEDSFPVAVTASTRPSIVALAGQPPAGTILMTKYVTPGLADALAEAGWRGFVDAAGNVSLNAPGLLVRVEGRRPQRSTPAPSSLAFSRTGLPVTFGLLVTQARGDHPTQRELARLTGSSLGTVNRVVKSLRESGRPYLDEHGRIVRPDALRDSWTRGFLDTQPDAWPTERFSSARWTTPQGVLGAMLPNGCLVSSELAAHRQGASIRPATALIYCPAGARADLIKAGRLRRDPDGTILIRPAFWSPTLLPDATAVPQFLIRADLLLEDDSRLDGVARDMETTWTGWT